MRLPILIKMKEEKWVAKKVKSECDEARNFCLMKCCFLSMFIVFSNSHCSAIIANRCHLKFPFQTTGKKQTIEASYAMGRSMDEAIERLREKKPRIAEKMDGFLEQQVLSFFCYML